MVIDFTLPDAETDKKRWGCIGFCGFVHIAQRQMKTQIPMGSVYLFSVFVSVNGP